MQNHIQNKFDYIINFIENNNVDEAAKELATSIMTNDKLQNELNFIFFGKLFDLDQALKLDNRGKFWKNNNIIQSSSDSINFYIDKILKNQPATNDILRIEELRNISKKYPNHLEFHYVLGLALAERGSIEENESLLLEALNIFENLQYSVPENQLSYFATNRANKLISYTSLLAPDKALAVLEKALNEKWIFQSGIIRNHIITQHSFLKTIIKSQNEFDNKIKLASESIQATAENYQSKNIEILSIFTALITLTLGGLTILPKIVDSSSDYIKLLSFLCLILMILHAFLFGLLRQKNWYVICAGILVIIVNIILYYKPL